MCGDTDVVKVTSLHPSELCVQFPFLGLDDTKATARDMENRPSKTRCQTETNVERCLQNKMCIIKCVL